MKVINFYKKTVFIIMFSTL